MQEALDYYDLKISEEKTVETLPEPAEQEACNHGYPLEEEPELLTCLDLLRKCDGIIRIRDRNRSLGLRFKGPASGLEFANRQALSEIIYKGKVVPFLLVLLPDGEYTPTSLAWWAGRSPKKGEGK